MVSSFCFGKEKVEEAHGISSGGKYRFLEIKWSIRSRPKVFELFCSKAFGKWKPKHLSHLGWEEKSFRGSCTKPRHIFLEVKLESDLRLALT